MGIDMNINFNKIISFSLPFLITILVAFIISSGLYLYLPKTAPIIIENNNKAIDYNKYQVYKSFKEKQKKVVKKKPVVKKRKEYILLNNITLKAIYALGNNRGFIKIIEKSTSITHSLKIGDTFKNKYKLKTIYPSFIIFEKNGLEYKVLMDDENIKSKYKNTIKTTANEIKKDDDGYILKKALLNRYLKNLDKIWQEISIKEIKKDGKISGFKINSLSSRSIFKKLGLKKDDIIISVNNIILTSYAQAFKIYKNMNKTTNLNIIIIRNGKEMELDYEIK
jgi:type II secretion system protein C